MIFIFTIIALSSCIFDDGKITVTRFGGGGSGVALAKVTSVSIVNDQLVVNGTDLNGVTGVRITGPSSFDESFSIESKSAANLIANGLGNVAFAMNGLFNLILTDAQGAATFQVTFTLQDGAVTANKLADMGAGVGQILKYNGTTWVASDLSALTYAGNWNGTANTPDLSTGGSNGEYYIVNNAGTFDLSGGPGTNSWAIGDWVVWNNVDGRWEKVDNATNVTSFNSRSGVVTPQTGDYTWAQINKTSSVLSEIADIDAPAGDGSDTGKVLKWNNATSRWELGDDLSGGGAGSVSSTEIANGAIVNDDVNVAAAIDQSKIANLTTDLAAKVPLAGATMTGDLTVPNLVTSGNVDGVDVSGLSTTVGTNTTSIGNNATAISNLDTDDVSEATALYFTDARAKASAVVNSTGGTETDQAASVAAMKAFVGTATSGFGSGDIADGGNTNASTVTIGTNDANSLELETNNNTAVTILSDGNVGIGTTGPDEILHVVGKSKIEINTGGVSTALEMENLSSGNDSGSKIDYVSDGVITSSISGRRGGSSSVGYLQFFTKNTSLSERMRISPSGFVGIGVSNPAVTLHQDNGNATANYHKFTAGTTTGVLSNSGFDIGISGTGDAELRQRFNGPINFLTNNSQKMTILSGGNVGVGTSSPNRLLEVAGPVRVSATALPGSPAAGDIAIDSADSNKLKWYDGSGWQNAGAASGTITSIGVTAPVATTGGTTPTLSMAQANGSTDGFLDSADWTTFNNKQAALPTGGSTAQYLRGDLTLATLQDDVRSTLLTGYISGAGTVAATDTIVQAFNKLNGNTLANTALISGLDTDDISEGSNLYFTDARAKASAVINSTGGTETDQAASVAAMKNYVASNSGDILDGGNTEAATVTIGTNDANSLALETNNSTAMTILSGGNIGIGTASPSNLLDVRGNIEISKPGGDPALTLSGVGNTSTEADIQFYDAGLIAADGSLHLNIDSNNNGTSSVFAVRKDSNTNAGADLMIITESGSVGIGTASPNSSLSIQGILSSSLTGTVDVTSGTAAVTGTGTSFDTELNVGDAIKIDDEVFTVLAIADASNLTLDSNHTVGASGATATSDPTILSIDSGDNKNLLSVDKSGLMNLNGIFALQESSGSDVINIRSPSSIAASYTLTLPTTDGASGEVLTTDGSGALSWAPAEAATSVSAGAGAAGTPSMSFSTDSNTGFYSSGADQIGIANNGSNTFNFTATALSSPTLGGANITTGNGTAAAPTFSFAGDEDTGWFRPAANELAASNAGSESVRIDSLGNVGIGTTNPNSLLHIDGGDVRAEMTTGAELIASRDDTTITTNEVLGKVNYTASSTANQGAEIVGRAESAWTLGSSTPGLLAFGTTSSGSTTSTERMRIDSSGNVGVGISTPLDRLQVAQASSGLGANFLIDLDTGVPGAELYRNITSISNTSAIGHLKFSASDGSVALQSDGNVLIVSDVNDTSGAAGSDIIFGYGSPVNIDANNAATYAELYPTGEPRVELMRIDASSGFVGIGTTTPDSLLNLKGENPILNIQNINVSAGSGGVLRFGHDQASNQTPIGEIRGELVNGGTSRAGDLSFWTSTGDTLSEAMRIDENGGVGIGTTSPEEKLDISNGNIHVSTGYGIGTSFTGTGAYYMTPYRTGINAQTALGSSAPYDSGMQFVADAMISFAEIDADKVVGYMDVNAEKFVWNGSMSIGTTGSAATLQVRAEDVSTDDALYLQTNVANADILMADSGSIAAENILYFNMDSDNDTTNGKIRFGKDGKGSSATTLMTIEEGGNVGIGTDSPAQKLDVDGNIAVSGSTVHTSDRRLKENIKQIEGSLDKIMQISGVEYFWKDRAKDPHKQIGVIAQEIQEFFPELVYENEQTGMLSVNYAGLVAPLIEATKEQQREIASLKDRVEELEINNNKMNDENREMKEAMCELKPSLSFCN